MGIETETTVEVEAVGLERGRCGRAVASFLWNDMGIARLAVVEIVRVFSDGLLKGGVGPEPAPKARILGR